MADITGYLEDLIHQWWSQNNDMPSAPSNIYVSLHTADEGNNPNGNDEVDAGDYSRAETSSSDWTITSGDGPTTVENDSEISFGDPTSGWGTVSHFALWDGSSDTDNPLWGTIELDSAEEVESDDDEVRFNAGELTIELD